ncbi:MAG: HEAT repeat domain-containing protein [bacterium]|nr:MAG: HEAT repeat domain-containing protein [bacterium]
MRNIRERRYLNILFLATAAVVWLLIPAGEGWAAKATVGGTTGATGQTRHQSTGVQSGMEILRRRYYLASEEERLTVLDEIRQLGTDEALAFNVDLLRYPDLKVRREAVDILKRWGHRGYLAVFEGMDDPEINWLCESIFMELGPRAVPFLQEMLDDERPAYRGRAAYLLGEIGDPISVGQLFNRLKDPDREVRIQVIQALCSLGDERSLEGILGLFESEDVGLVDFVLQAAEKFGARAAAPLRAALKSGSERVRAGAALALGRIRLPSTLPDLFQCLDDPSVSVRRSAVKAMDSFHHVSAAEGLFRALRDPDLEVQDYATSALARLHPDVFDSLIEALGDRNPRVRKNAVIALRKMGDRKAVPVIINALEDADPNVRMFAVTALIEFKDPRAIKPLILRLQVEDEIAWLASFAFMEIGKTAVEELLRATGDDTFCMTRDLIILQMGDRALETLHSMAKQGETTVRYNAIALLGELRRSESVPVLAGLLPDPDAGWVAANALGKMGKEGWGALRDAAAGSGVGRDNALVAISKIEDPLLYLDLTDCMCADDRPLRMAAAEPLVRGGGKVVNLVVEQMAGLEGLKFADAAEILCRMKDQGAIGPLTKVLFPEPWQPAVLDPGRLYDLRQAYLAKGSLDPVMDRLRKEAGGTGGGGAPWERVVP